MFTLFIFLINYERLEKIVQLLNNKIQRVGI